MADTTLNTKPIYSRKPDVQWVNAVVTANTTTDLTSGTIYLVFTADATNGSRVEKLRIRSLGTNVATVLRVWINNGAVTSTAANNTLFTEITAAATTASQVAAIAELEITMNLALNPGYKIYVTTGTTIAAGYDVTAVAGDY